MKLPLATPEEEPITSKQLIKRFIFDDFDDEKQKHKWYDYGDDEATIDSKVEYQYRRLYRMLTKLKIWYSRIIPAGYGIHFRTFGDDEADRQIFNYFMKVAEEKGLLDAAAETLEVADKIRLLV